MGGRKGLIKKSKRSVKEVGLDHIRRFTAPTALFYLDWLCIGKQRFLSAFSEEFCFTHTTFTLCTHIIFFSRHSCQWKLLICHAAAGGFPLLPRGVSKNYPILPPPVTFTLSDFAICFRPSLFFLAEQPLKKNTSGVCFTDDFDNSDLSPPSLTLMVWCKFYDPNEHVQINSLAVSFRDCEEEPDWHTHVWLGDK